MAALLSADPGATLHATLRNNTYIQLFPQKHSGILAPLQVKTL
jgi:hypothetical protein